MLQEKPHKCSLCAKSFPTPGDLKAHMYVHTGTWPYRCTICSRGFSKQTNLKNHLLLHETGGLEADTLAGEGEEEEEGEEGKEEVGEGGGRPMGPLSDLLLQMVKSAAGRSQENDSPVTSGEEEEDEEATGGPGSSPPRTKTGFSHLFRPINLS